MKKITRLALVLFSLVAAAPAQSFAVGQISDFTISPVRTVLQLLVSPLVGTTAGGVVSSEAAAKREMVMNAVANDAAAYIDGADQTPLLQEVNSMLRVELKKRGDQNEYTDRELALQILAEIN